MQRTRLTGRLERRDLGTGVWILHTPSGEVALYGDVPHALAGQQVEVEGESNEGFGIAMTGPAVTVWSVRKA